MPSKNKNRPLAWRFQILGNILVKHGFIVDRWHEQTYKLEQINEFYRAIHSLRPPTLLEHLDILRLFEKSLSTQNLFKNENNPPDVVDLFYGSFIAGLKASDDSDKLLLFNEIVTFLPETNPYVYDAAKSAALERVFIRALEWKIEPDEDTLTAAYTPLFKPLDKRTLAAFSSEFLMLSFNGSGDWTSIHKMLCITSAPLGKSVDAAMTTLKELPLVYCYIDDKNIRKLLKQTIFSFLQGRRKSLLTDNLKHAMKASIRRYFNTRKRAISAVELSDMAFYFEPETIRAIQLENVRFRLSTIKLTLPCSKSHLIFDSLSDELSSGQLDPNWLSQALSVLQSLKANNALSEAIFTVAFSHRWHTLSILNAYAAINSEGWLVLINQIPTLCLEVETLVLAHHASTHFIALIHEALSAHFSEKKPTPPQLKRLNDTATSTLGKQLAAPLTIEWMLEEMRNVESTLNIDSHSLKKQHEAIAAYFDTHEHERGALFYTITRLTSINLDLLKSLYLNILSKPEQMQFKIRLAICLPSSLMKYTLEPITAKAPTLLSRIYKEINKNTAALNALRAYFTLYFSVSNDDNYTLKSIPLIGSLVRGVIDRAITSGEINLTRTQADSLVWFYTGNKMLKHIETQSPLLLPPITLFSPTRNQEQHMDIIKSPGYQSF